MSINAGTRMVMSVAESLTDLLEHFVFVGGAVTDLLVTETIHEGTRPTKDVDIITEIGSYSTQSSFEEILRKKGFEPDQDGPICRWIIGENLVDFMPLEKNVLGFTNQWYESAVKNAVVYTLPNTIQIRLISAPYFLATKTCAFLNRGQSDFYSNSDIEDMIRVIDGRPEIIDEIGNSAHDLQKYLSEHWKRFLDTPEFRESIQWIWSDAASQARYPLIIKQIEKFCLNRI